MRGVRSPRLPGWPVLLGAVLVVAAGCGDGAGEDGRVVIDPSMTVDEAIDAGASVLWVGAHPDDETVPGSLLARACAALGNRCRLVILTPGEGGTCFAPPCLPDIETVRRAEMEGAARGYGAEVEVHDFSNSPDDTIPMEDTIARWESEGDPIRVIVEAVRRFRPNLVLSFDPSLGFTGHNEHRAASLLTDEALPLAADPAYEASGTRPFRADRLYHVLNRYWFMLPFVGWDDGPVTDSFPLHEPCPGTDKTCFELGLEAAQAHRCQWPFIAAMALAGPLVDQGFLKLVDF